MAPGNILTATKYFVPNEIKFHKSEIVTVQTFSIHHLSRDYFLYSPTLFLNQMQYYDNNPLKILTTSLNILN